MSLCEVPSNGAGLATCWPARGFESITLLIGLSRLRVVVIREIAQSQYLGVLCSRCDERIPAPRSATLLYGELSVVK
jgi:hypothetical protein